MHMVQNSYFHVICRNSLVQFVIAIPQELSSREVLQGVRGHKSVLQNCLLL